MISKFFTDEQLADLDFQHCLNCGWRGGIEECVHEVPDEPDEEHLVIYACPKCKSGTV